MLPITHQHSAISSGGSSSSTDHFHHHPALTEGGHDLIGASGSSPSTTDNTNIAGTTNTLTEDPNIVSSPRDLNSGRQEAPRRVTPPTPQGHQQQLHHQLEEEHRHVQHFERIDYFGHVHQSRQMTSDLGSLSWTGSEMGHYPIATAGPIAQGSSPLDSTAIAIKMLVSNNVAGSIIGRSGQTISELQSESNTRLKLSQSGDFYPGTQDRVCLVQGEPDAVKVALRLLLTRLYMLQESQHAPVWQKHQQQLSLQQHPSDQAEKAASPLFDFIVRLLVPLSCCGMIIGKSGTNIKFMEENSGVSSVRLSPKEETSMTSTSERIVTVTGHSVGNCLRCCCLVLDGMASHHEISQYLNMTTSYANCMGQNVSSGYSSPSQMTPSQQLQAHQASLPIFQTSSPSVPQRNNFPYDQHHNLQQQHQQQQLWSDRPVTPVALAGTSLNRRSASTPDLPGAINFTPRIAESPRLTNHEEVSLRHVEIPAYNTNQANYSYSPMQTPQPSVSFPSNQLQQTMFLVPRHAQAVPTYLNAGSGSIYQQPQGDVRRHTFSQSSSAPNLLAIQLEQSLILSHPPHPPSPLNFQQHQQQPPHGTTSSVFVPQSPIMIAPGSFNAQVLVPDSMIGSILGRGGRALTELQMITGTRIRISQRGLYMPGTRSRIVTVRGPNAQTVWHAQILISQRMVLPPTASYTSVATAPLSSSYGQLAFESGEAKEEGDNNLD